MKWGLTPSFYMQSKQYVTAFDPPSGGTYAEGHPSSARLPLRRRDYTFKFVDYGLQGNPFHGAPHSVLNLTVGGLQYLADILCHGACPPLAEMYPD